MDVASLVERSESPAKPKDDAAEPSEMAHSVKVTGCNTVPVAGVTQLEEHEAGQSDVHKNAGDAIVEPQKMESHKQKEGESSESGRSDCSFVSQNGILTESMIEEEKQLHQHTMEEEQKMKEERAVAINSMDEDMKEQRYKRLQFLLSKSNMYTSYLIERMRRQAEEETKKKERLAKKQAREAEKKKTVVDEVDSQKTSIEQDVSAETDVSSCGDHSQETPGAMETESATAVADAACDKQSKETSVMEPDQPETQNDSPRSRRRGRLRNTQSEDNSQGSTNSEKNKTDAETKKRGQKRKASASNPESYKISDYFQEALSRSKRQKVDLDQQDKVAEKKEVAEKASDVDENKPHDCSTTSGKQPAGEKQESSEPIGGRKNSEGEEISEQQPALFTGGVLRPYQIQGFQWLKILYENGVNGILADEMGLGKTIQCIATIAHLAYNGVPGPFLVCAPLSTVPNWMSEFQRFAPKVPVILYHGQKDERMRLRRKISRRYPLRKGVEVHPVVITSYEICMNDRKYMSDYQWRYLIVDEGHRIKNFQCKLIRELKMYHSTNRLLLTGTPLQNNLSELWSLLNFLLPEIFDDLGSFESWFDIDCLESEDIDEQIVREEQRKNILSMLHQILTPFLLRRLKSDVELVIPPKREVMVYAPLTKLQESYYRSAVDKTIHSLVGGNKEEKEETVELDTKGRPKRRAAKNIDPKILKAMSVDNSEKDDDEEEIEKWITTMAEQQALREKEMNSQRAYKTPCGPETVERNIKLTNIMMLLRKTCSHPYLLEYPLTEAGDYKIDDNLIKASGKTLLLDRMLTELKKRGHKVLLFSQMTKLLDILEDYCYLKKYKFSRLDGSMKVEDRRDQMDQFNKDPDVFLFLLSTRAGGLGINLVAADTVVIYDSDWNPQSDLQAQDRCHRIGQTRPVMVYRLVTANTIDQKIVERAAAKRKLEKMVIHKGKFKSGMANFSTSMAPISPQELLQLLKSVDYDEAIGASDKSVISTKDLNRLLDRSDLDVRWKEQQENKRNQESSKKASKKATTTQVKGVFKVMSEEDGKTGLESDVNIAGSIFDTPKESDCPSND